jgi:spore coat protein CotF
MNTTNQNTNFTEQQILQDSLMSQKHLTDSYNMYAGECVNEQLRNTMLGILSDEHKIQADIFNNMQAKGWYQVEQAEQQKIQQARQKFSTNSAS